GLGFQHEVVAAPALAPRLDAHLVEDPAAIAALDGQRYRGRPVGAGPDVALVRLARAEVEAPAGEPPVLDADLAFAALKRQALTLRADERLVRRTADRAAGRAAGERPPHPADGGVAVLRHEGDLPDRLARLDPEVAKPRRPLPDPQPDSPRTQRVF